MKVIIAGSRSIIELKFIYMAVRQSGFKITEVVSGKANGVDTLGEQWAAENHIPVAPFPADWRPNGIYNPNAGFERNADMAEYADKLIAVWDGVSGGTKDMIKTMKGLKKQYYVFRTDIPQESNIFDMF